MKERNETRPRRNHPARIEISPDLRLQMVEVARAFRKTPTHTEERLWRGLRSGKLQMKFRRQHPIGPFIVDFYCPQHSLIVEVDGPIHETQIERDRERQSLLEACGYRVMRVEADEVLSSLPSILARIRAVCIDAERIETPTEFPSPLEGEGQG